MGEVTLGYLMWEGMHKNALTLAKERCDRESLEVVLTALMLDHKRKIEKLMERINELESKVL